MNFFHSVRIAAGFLMVGVLLFTSAHAAPLDAAFVSGQSVLRWPLATLPSGGSRSTWGVVQDYAHFGSFPPGRAPYTPKYHTGLDIPAPAQTCVRAAASGMIHYYPMATINTHAMGNVITIEHSPAFGGPANIVTLYAHLSTTNFDTLRLALDGTNIDINANPNQCIGYTGNTGGAYPYHLHFEVKQTNILGSADGLFWGYTPFQYPGDLGYLDPFLYLHNQVAGSYNLIYQITTDGNGKPFRFGPSEIYPSLGYPAATGEKYRVLAMAAGTTACDGGWYQIEKAAGSNGHCDTIPPLNPARTYSVKPIIPPRGDSRSCFKDNNDTGTYLKPSLLPRVWICSGHLGKTYAALGNQVDLIPTALSASVGSVARGGNFTVSDTVQNVGTSNVTAANIRVRYYLSTDIIITATDRLIGSRIIPASALVAGASSPSIGTLTVPASTPVGTYTLGMIVDATNAQVETNEANNTRTGGTLNITAVATLPACTAISPEAPSVTLDSASPPLTATCTNNPTGWVWKLDGIALSCTEPTCTVPAASLPTATTYTVTVTANNAGGAGTQAASATITVTAPTAASNLNDTGITASQCYQAGSDVLVDCGSAGAIALNNAQDGMTGRDANAATNSNTDGKLGFSFSSVTGGCVQDNVTGLMWEVKTTDGGLRDWTKIYTNYTPAYGSLYGTATDTSGFVAAVNATNLCGYSDWRLPTAEELQSIVDYGVASPGPAVDATWFPNTQGGFHWSASPDVVYSSGAWYVDFSLGSGLTSSRNSTYFVRLVRGGQSPILSRYTVTTNGQEITDNQTNLIWRRCAEGMNWDGATCAGVASTFTYDAALQLAAVQVGSTGIAWRLPNVNELASIADKTRYPAIDPMAFPSTPLTNWFWSASPCLCYYGFAWAVDFKSGIIGYGYHNNNSNVLYVRLVRTGQ